jgi:putative nucleotidyltransferase with HDIG domain
MGSDDHNKRPHRAGMMVQQAKWILLAVVISLFVILLYPNLVVQQYRYSVGDIAERSIKAPQDFFIEDRAATEASRRQAVDQTLTVYDQDSRISQQINASVILAFREMRKVMGDFDATQDAALDDTNEMATAESIDQKRNNEWWAKKEAFENALGIEVSDGAFNILIDQAFSKVIPERITQILRVIHANGVVSNKEVLLKEIEKGITIRNVANQTENSVLALRQFYGPDQAKTMVRIIAEPLVEDLNYNLVNLIVDFCQQLIHPNITLNRNETEKRKDQAVAGVKSVMYQIKAGEMLVREGERITEDHLLKINVIQQQTKNAHIASAGLGAALVMAVLIVVIYTLLFTHQRFKYLNSNKNTLFLVLVLSMVFGIAKMSDIFTAVAAIQTPFSISASSIAYAAPAAAGSMLVCIFLGFEVALPFALISSAGVAILLGNRVELFIYFFISSTMGAHWVQHCRERKVFITAGARLGLINIVLAASVSFFSSNYAGLKLLTDLAMAFSGGIASAIITVGIAPVMEMTFHYTTDITLLELANLDRPILRRLMLEAPGTYHHSVIVGSLVEAAATEIGANPLLSKVCGYYHDIGKVKKPLYFIENQKTGKNKHDKLAPSMSSLILIAHVKDGVEIARSNKLGQVIIDTIQQHHGTSLITYFYDKAKWLKGQERVKADDYRYPGPKPQTKEAGLVMLADVVEAASRTLDNPTPARIQGLVQNLVNRIFSDGQLDDCELTLKDLHSIAKSFNKILTGIHHHRIEYGETTRRENSRGKYGNPDRQSAEKLPSRDRRGPEDSPGHLKRLGLP